MVALIGALTTSRQTSRLILVLVRCHLLQLGTPLVTRPKHLDLLGIFFDWSTASGSSSSSSTATASSLSSTEGSSPPAGFVVIASSAGILPLAAALCCSRCCWRDANKTLLNKSLNIYDVKRTMFCLSFQSRDRQKNIVQSKVKKKTARDSLLSNKNKNLRTNGSSSSAGIWPLAAVSWGASFVVIASSS
jgi:hypothetical protein